MGLKDRFNGDLLAGSDAADEREGAGREGASYGIGYFKRKLLEEVDLAEIVKLGPSQRRARLERVVGRHAQPRGPGALDRASAARLIRRVVDEALGLGVLEPLLADASITEIMVNGPDEVFVERDGRLERTDIALRRRGQLTQTIDRIVSTVNRRVDESSPMVDARLPTGERVNVIIPPLALSGPTLTIRRFPRAFTLEQLIEMGSIDAPTRPAAARARASAQAQRRRLRRHRHGQDDAAQRAVGAASRPASASSPSRTPPSSSSSSRTSSRSRRARRTSRARARSRSATSCATRCACAPTASSSARSAAPRRSTCSRRMNTGHDGSLVTVHANSRRRRDPPPRRRWPR